MDLEKQASAIHGYEPLVVPGLLQTEETARALFTAGRFGGKPEVIDTLIDIRMQRQQILAQKDRPALWFVVDETVIRRPIGGGKVHAAQLDHLLDAAARPGITVQVVPFDAGAHGGLAGPFYILSFNNGPDIAYAEDPVTGHFHERPELVRAMSETYDAIRATVLPAKVSLELIRHVREEL